MPLTFAHPAAILPFSRKSKYINFSAMVLGSMAPDFEYFLRGQPFGEIGHTFIGFLFLNLPLVTLIYFIYHLFIHQTLFNHLPIFLQDSYSKKSDSSTNLKIIVFCYSALFGMLTHVIWDSFTHMNGFMVINSPILTYTFSVYGFDIPLYKFLQHGSTLFGITMIFGYLYYRALSQRSHKNLEVYPKQKFIYWSSIFFLTTLSVILWFLIDYVSVMSYGIIVVRIIDSALMSLLIVSLVFKYRQNESE
ncbi:DUF4184 family protein [Peribacillus loiseleuriae]|uniref:DUF4184 family protein n=1 Tax=Peribacillus loiseleuriae TaxID=1679170 RepID=A0A0K9GSR3_9BACI|nr:DUF4184 family protein [Peribacillus loiseleuriae]KMY49675.1 hypothetical protein AC625_09095 [Peribacillus loiseleuriae]